MTAASYIFLKAEANNGEVPDVVGTKCCIKKNKKERFPIVAHKLML